jgi:hypothetical protein
VFPQRTALVVHTTRFLSLCNRRAVFQPSDMGLCPRTSRQTSFAADFATAATQLLFERNRFLRTTLDPSSIIHETWSPRVLHEPSGLGIYMPPRRKYNTVYSRSNIERVQMQKSSHYPLYHLLLHIPYRIVRPRVAWRRVRWLRALRWLRVAFRFCFDRGSLGSGIRPSHS